MSKKVLFISDHGDPLAELGGKQAGGQNNYVKQLALALEDIGWQVDVATHWCETSAPRIEHFGQNCRVIRIAAGEKGFVPKDKMFGMLSAFYRELKTAVDLSSYDVTHTHYYLSGLIGIKVRDEYAIPFVHTSHSLGWAKTEATGIRDERREQAETEILQTADYILATTKSEKLLIQERVENPAPIQVIPIGVDAAFRTFGSRKQLRKNLGHSEPLFVFAGRLEETKGIFTLLEAFQILMKRNSGEFHPSLLLAGGEPDSINPENGLPYDERLRTAVNGAEGQVQFLGPQTQEQLAELFNAATATLVPSHYESFGMVAAEAQACGSPVIASNVGGLKNVVRDGITGLLTEGGNAHDLAVAMEVLAVNSILAERMSRRAEEVANQEFQWPSISKQVNSLYEVIADVRSNTYFGDRFGRDASGRS
ncbi:glycosyltransferase [Planococcus lenghuensis]|uniref:Glycosyl transferase family 1 n=1 Tax=Planococcus lenghuensis TaxID=2213202 RepID=A0A1Q2KVB0_9BACL|nr:glycosyltransferase [Planococcus lenghuensis]AQQ52119.1 glycosyl transferase family 1 [Planococcus lenghuensis]